MDDRLSAIKTAATTTDEHPKDLVLARQLADQFVADNPDLYTEYPAKNVVELVEAVDVLRLAGMEDEQWRVEAWLLHRYEPQNIGGPVEATVRIAEEG